MATILITGGTGMIGTRLTEMLADRGYDVIILTRDTTKHHPSPGVSYANWDIDAQAIDRDAIGKADHIIHLAGAGVADKRWSQARKQEILRSRTESSALIVKALKEYPNKVQSVISSSAIGWYGPDTPRSLKEGFTEEAPADTAFLGETCRQWEASIEPVTGLGKRLVKLRTGIVLSDRGGALAEFRKPVMGGVAAILGNGNQVVSWIHVEDLCSMFLFAVENHSLAGAYNAVAPNPVTNKTLTLTIAQKLRGRFYIPVYVPAFVLKIVLGEMSIEVLKSAHVSARKIQQAGFDFSYPVIDKALDHLLAG
ncbi:MAG: TIGR01777 family protein [Bacteroidetes bacterium]|nr:TIGR01777 family protein [Bacteroidota bacterium]